jgi:hypothetical protein
VSSAEPVKVGCEADEECPLDKACHNTLCVNPCQCGINAECTVINHKPLCYCPPGYSGNPEIECQKREWKIVGLKILGLMAVGLMTIGIMSVGICNDS